MRELLTQLPTDAVERVNAKIPRKKGRRVGCFTWKGKPKFPKNLTLNGYVNQILLAAWEKEDKLAVCERLQKQGSPHVWARPPCS